MINPIFFLQTWTFTVGASYRHCHHCHHCHNYHHYHHCHHYDHYDHYHQTIESAVRAGLNYVDTSPFYGEGKSEEVLGTMT